MNRLVTIGRASTMTKETFDSAVDDDGAGSFTSKRYGIVLQCTDNPLDSYLNQNAACGT